MTMGEDMLQSEGLRTQLLQNQRDISQVVLVANNALAEAAKSARALGSHEELCALRYKTIEGTLEGQSSKFLNVFQKLDKLTIVVYIGVGVWVGLPVLGGAIFGIIELISVVR